MALCMQTCKKSHYLVKIYLFLKFHGKIALVSPPHFQLETGTAYRFGQATRRHQTYGAETYHARPAARARPTWRVRTLPTPLPVCICAVLACAPSACLFPLCLSPLCTRELASAPPLTTRAVGTSVNCVCTVAGLKDLMAFLSHVHMFPTVGLSMLT